MFDPARRRKATRAARQKGCFIYIPAEALQAAQPKLGDRLPYYRTWAGKGGAVLVRLYLEP